MIKKTIKKKLSILLIISMIFTSSGVNTFANVEAGSHPQAGSFGETHPYEESEVDINETTEEIEANETVVDVETDGTTIEADTEEITVGADIIRPADDINEETKIFDSENIEEEPESELETEVKEETIVLDSENIEEETEKNETIEIESKEIKISTDSEIEEEIKNEDEEEVVEVDTEELETVSKEIYGATPTNRSVTFSLPKDLVEEGIFSFQGGNGTISEDGCSLTQDFGMAMGNSTQYVNAPQVAFNNCPNQGITFNRQWNGDGKTLNFGQGTQLTFTDSKSTIEFSLNYTDERGELTLLIADKDLEKVTFDEDQGEGKKVKVEGKSKLTTKFYRTYYPKMTFEDEGNRAWFGKNEGYGEITTSKQNASYTAQIDFVGYKVIYNMTSEVGQNMTLQGLDGGRVRYEENIPNSTKEFVLKRLNANSDEYKKKLVAWVNTETQEEFLPDVTYKHEGKKHYNLEPKLREYESVTVNYRSDHGTINFYGTPEKGTCMATPSTLYATGYTFKYWYLDNENEPFSFYNTPINENMTFTAKWEEKEYNVTLNTYDGVYVEGYTAPSNKRKYSERVILPTENDIKKEGNTFKGWYTQENGSGTKKTEIAANTDEDVTLYLYWQPDQYHYSYNVGSGGRFPDGTTTGASRYYGEEIILYTGDKLPTREGYKFLHWDLKDANGFIIKENATKIEATQKGNVTVEAKWEELEYDLILDLKGGSYKSSYTAPSNKRKYTEAVILPTVDDVEKKGATFVGWYENEEYTGNVVTRIDSCTIGNKNLYAKWNEAEFEVEYNLNDGSFISGYTAPTKRKYSEALTLPDSTKIEKIGSGFDGWYESADFSGNKIEVIPENTERKVVLYAKWIERDYKVTYHLNDGSYVEGYTPTTSRKYGDAIWLPKEANVKKEGYTFYGWYENEDFTGRSIDVISSDVIRDVEVFLRWSEKTYINNFVLKGGTLKDGGTGVSSRYYTSEIILPTSDEISKKGSTFIGWRLRNKANNQVLVENATKIEAKYPYDVDVEAVWQENSYTITYYDYGATYAQGFSKITKRNYSDAVTLPTSAETSKKGYTFGGWYTNDKFEGSPITKIDAETDSDTVVYLKWIENEYIINYVLFDGSYAQGSNIISKRKFTEAVTLPTKNDVYYKGNDFKGWYEKDDFSGIAATNVPANTDSDKTFYAKWEEAEYNIIYHEDGGKYAQTYTKKNKRKYSESVTLPNENEITKDGATFLGWYSNADFTGNIITTIPANTEEDVHVYLKWDEAEFDIIYHENGGVYKDSYTKITRRRYSDSVVLPQNVNISKKGFAFGGWYEEPDFSGNRITTIQAKTARNVEVYANWVVGNYNITYNLNGGKYVDGYTPITDRGYTDEVILPTKNDLIKDYFDLEGWYETSNFKGSMITKIPANTDSNKVLYAKWVGKEYKVNLNTNGGVIKSGNVLKYRHTIGAILPTNVEAPKSETDTKAKKFAGWYENENLTGNMVSRIDANAYGEKTYYAKYSYVYNVKFNPGGGSGVMDTLIIDEGKTFTVPENGFDRSGYKFTGWTSSDGKVYEVKKSYTSNADITLTATWEEIKKEDTSSGGDSGSTDSGNTGGGSSSGGSTTGGGSPTGDDSGTGGGSSTGEDSGKGSESSSGGSTTGGGSSTGGKTSGGTSSGGTSSGGSSRGGSSSGTSGGTSSGGSSSGGSTTGGGSISGASSSGPGVSAGDTSPVVPVIPNVGVPSAENANVTNEVVKKEIESGNAKPGMYYAWEMNNNKWRAKDMVTNDYAKNTFVYVDYAGKLRKYFFDANGDMVVGWINHNGYIYYMNPQEGINYGDMMTGVNIVDGILCEFLPSGEFYRTIM